MEQRKKYRQHPFSERLKAVELYKKGYTSKRIGHLMDLDDSMVRRWVRKYRAKGVEALRPYSRSTENGHVGERTGRSKNELLFYPAYEVYSSSLEPVASIARRYQFDYLSFKYHVERYHPELVAKRTRLNQLVCEQSPIESNQ